MNEERDLCVVFDLDGCISDDHWRRNKIDTTTVDLDKRYEAYNLACHYDRSMNEGVLLGAAANPNVCVLFITARPELVRKETEAWINEKFPTDSFSNPWSLLMRPQDNYWHSPALKCHLLTKVLSGAGMTVDDVFCCYDDRADVLRAYRAMGIDNTMMLDHQGCAAYTETGPALKAPKQMEGAAKVLHDMAVTYQERNAVYGSNYKMVGPLMAVLFPDGVPPELVVKHQFHLFELILVKLSRFAISNLEHVDSIHDLSVYGAMIEAIITEEETDPCPF